MKKRKLRKELENNKSKITVNFSLIEVIIITIMTAIVVSVCSGVIVYKNYDSIAKNYSNTLSSPLNEFLTTYNHILDSYVEKINESGLVDSAIKGMFDYLEDSHTDYLEEDDTISLQDRLNGKYTGIGIEVGDTESGIIISNVFTDSPAHKAGIEAGDKIISINDIDVTNKGASYISEIIKNKNDKFQIEVERKEEIKSFTISTTTVIIPSVITEIFDKTGYIKIDTFSATTYNQFKEKLEELEKSKIDNLIIDVRNNTGGYLNSAYDIADLFISKGKIIYQLKDKDGNIESHNAKSTTKREYEIALLINGSSASASEILAASLNESYGAILIGTETFGKGTVQNTEKLSSGSMIKYTTAHWLTPSGICIDNIGIKPTYEVIMDRSSEDDNQLLEALSIINKQ